MPAIVASSWSKRDSSDVGLRYSMNSSYVNGAIRQAERRVLDTVPANLNDPVQRLPVWDLIDNSWKIPLNRCLHFGSREPKFVGMSECMVNLVRVSPKRYFWRCVRAGPLVLAAVVLLA